MVQIQDTFLRNRMAALQIDFVYLHHTCMWEFKFGGLFIWDTNAACPGHFLSVFEPIDKLIFATNSSRYVLDNKAKIVYENSYAVMHGILMQNKEQAMNNYLTAFRSYKNKLYLITSCIVCIYSSDLNTLWCSEHILLISRYGLISYILLLDFNPFKGNYLCRNF